MKNILLIVCLLLVIGSKLQTAEAHHIGEPYLGGIVFWVDINGKSGLVAATADLGNVLWTAANAAVTSDWRLPSQEELRTLCWNKDCAGLTGFTTTDAYWTSQKWGNSSSSGTYTVLFSTCAKDGETNTTATHHARLVRAFSN